MKILYNVFTILFFSQIGQLKQLIHEAELDLTEAKTTCQTKKVFFVVVLFCC